MLYALSHKESAFVDSLWKVVHLAPCFHHKMESTRIGPYADRTIMQMPSRGVYGINGPNWDQDLKTICYEFGPQTCSLWSIMTGMQGNSVKSAEYTIMNGTTGRFQEFADKWLDGVSETDLVQMSNIK